MVNSNELFLINYWKMITISIMSNTIVLPDGTVISSCDPRTGQCVHPQTGEQINPELTQIIKIFVDVINVRLNDGTKIPSYLVRYCHKSERYIRIDTNEPITLSKEYQSFLTLNQLEYIVQKLFKKYSGTDVNINRVSEKGYEYGCSPFYVVQLEREVINVPFTHLQMTQIKYIGDGLTHLFFSRRGSSDLFQIVGE
jgi:hypothetical protein